MAFFLGWGFAISGQAHAAAAKPLQVASKAFSESVILGEVVAGLERAAGVPTEHRPGLGGTRLVWDALVQGSVDVYPEYTGTLLTEIFAPPALADAAIEPVETRDYEWLKRTLRQRGVGLSEPLGFDNSYAIGVTRSRAQALSLRQISDLARHPELRFGFSNEFMSRRDGWPALEQRYALPQQDVRGLDHDLAYRALVQGSIDATDVYTTDAEIRRYGLSALADDRQFFQRYDAVVLYRLDLGARFGKAAVRAIERLPGRIDRAQMASLNARVKLDHVSESQAAADFLRATFAVESAGSAPSALTMIASRCVEHLLLVGVSLFAAISLAVPLGILAARRRKLGQLVLAATGVIQTLPTLALLVFMIPLFGIGALPAMVALFLYSLLPIVRNTHAGLTGIPEAVLESAWALGLPKGAVLRLVELPLASPLILAGIKSAAVINVGTATLGALVGAGGLGQPIFTGIRLDDQRMILQGAVPASLLALAVQGLFEGLERWLVPRGLRSRPSA